MKRIYLILLFILASVNVTNAQYRTFVGISDAYGASLGYSNMYLEKESYMPKDIFNIDFQIHGLYLGIGYGSNTLYTEWDRWGGTYSESVDSYIWRAGVSFRVGRYDYAAIITPFIGCKHTSYNEGYVDYYRYYDYYYNTGYYYSDYVTTYTKTLHNKFLYGIKVGVKLTYIEVGAIVSNQDIGVTIGFSMFEMF